VIVSGHRLGLPSLTAVGEIRIVLASAASENAEGESA
jgi:hypothetical protein